MPKERLYGGCARVAYVATTEKISDQNYRENLKQAVRDSEIGQREWPTEIQNSLLYAYLNGIVIVYASGKPFDWPLVDDVWGNNERYIREFLASTHCSYPARDSLIDLYFRIMEPELAVTFHD